MEEGFLSVLGIQPTDINSGSDRAAIISSNRNTAVMMSSISLLAYIEFVRAKKHLVTGLSEMVPVV